MECLEVLVRVLQGLGLRVFTGGWPGVQAGDYVVLLPLSDVYDFYADDVPGVEIQYVRVNFFTRDNYLALLYRVLPVLRGEGLVVSERRYVGYDAQAGYHHYVVEVACQTQPH